MAWHLLTLSTPIGRKMATRVRDGGGPLLRVRRADLLAAGVEWSEARTVGVRRGKPMLADGQVLDVANVVWCTGFRPDYGWIHLPVIGADGWPAQHRGVVPSAPGLFFLGIPFLSGFTSMLVIGAGRDAAYVVDRIAAAGRTRIRPEPVAGARLMAATPHHDKELQMRHQGTRRGPNGRGRDDRRGPHDGIGRDRPHDGARRAVAAPAAFEERHRLVAVVAILKGRPDGIGEPRRECQPPYVASSELRLAINGLVAASIRPAGAIADHSDA